MNTTTQIFIILATAIFTSHSASASASKSNHRFQVVTETTENKNLKYKVIEIDPDLLADQNRISQRVVFEKLGKAGLENAVLKQALSQLAKNDLREKNSMSRQSLRNLSGRPHSGLWTPVKNFWTLADEKDYTDWFTANVTSDFNKGTNLLADCADVGLLFRWAYAHDKKLPVANTLGGTGKLFGHFSSSAAWDNLPTDPDWRKDERFKAAMSYLFDNSFTHTLVSDLYPTEINTQFVHPGSLYMIIRQQSGHTQTIFKFDQANSGMRSLWGNEPAREDIYESWLMWEPAVKNVFGSWRWPTLVQGQWRLTRAENMVGYSLEQFVKREEFQDEGVFEIWVLSKVGMLDFAEGKLKRQMGTVMDALRYRKSVTALGAAICGFVHCDPNGPDADSYGTTSRDGRLKQAQVDLLQTIEQMGGMDAEAIKKVMDELGVLQVFIAGYNLTFKDFIFSKDQMFAIQSDANLTFRERWGLSETPNSKAEFSFLNQQFEIVISNRQSLFDLALYYCYVKQCDSQDIHIKNLETAKIDQGLKYLGKDLDDLQNSADLINEVDFLNNIKARYQLAPLSYYDPELITSEHCKIANQCTLYDVLWQTDSLKKIENWKHKPEDSLVSRWAL